MRNFAHVNAETIDEAVAVLEALREEGSDHCRGHGPAR